MKFSTLSHLLAAAVSMVAMMSSADLRSQDNVLNLYSSRHYPTDQSLYTGFTKATGARINLIEAGEDALIERLRNEGARSPADVLVTVDAGRLWRAEQLGLLLPVKSAVLESRIPANLREPGGHWFGFATRARVIAYAKSRVSPDEIASYESLADPKWKGRICVRSSTHMYNLSMLSALIEHLGESRAESWARAVRGNLARDPKGGDSDQVKGVAQGECDVALVNHYYYARFARSDKAEDKTVTERVGVVFPDQRGRGTHVNISGAAVLKAAPHRDIAVKFLEYLASDEAQVYFADGNNEWPVVQSVAVSNPVLASFDRFKVDALNVAALGRHQAAAQRTYDRVGWK